MASLLIKYVYSVHPALNLSLSARSFSYLSLNGYSTEMDHILRIRYPFENIRSDETLLLLEKMARMHIQRLLYEKLVMQYGLTSEYPFDQKSTWFPVTIVSLTYQDDYGQRHVQDMEEFMYNYEHGKESLPYTAAARIPNIIDYSKLIDSQILNKITQASKYISLKSKGKKLRY